MSIVERERTEVQTEVTRRDVLHRAADLIEEFGWTQGQWADCGLSLASENNLAFHKGIRTPRAFCMVGAVVQARRDFGDPEALHEIGAQACYDVPWNDEPFRTKPEVVARLREAAEQS